MTVHQPTSPYLSKPLRSEEEARGEMKKNCTRCGGRGFIVMRSLNTGKIRDFDCPACSSPRELAEIEGKTR